MSNLALSNGLDLNIMTQPSTNLSFPSIGEAIKLLFDVSGLLPQKHNQSECLPNEKDKKTLQTKLQRLSKEKGNLDNYFPELAGTLGKLLIEATMSPSITGIALKTIEDLHVAYERTVSNEATYSSKKENIKWILECWLPDLIIMSVRKYSLISCSNTEHINLPQNSDWWLPTYGERVITPLERNWRWIYDQAKTSQYHFHNPSHCGGRALQNLENASRWFRRGRIPTWSELVSNIDTSTNLLANCEDERHQRSLTPEMIRGFKIVLFFARASTDIFNRVESAYGPKFTKNLVHQINAQNRRSIKVHHSLQKKVKAKLLVKGLSQSTQLTEQWASLAHDYLHCYREKLLQDAKFLEQSELMGAEVDPTFTDIKKLIRRCEPFLISQAFRQKKYTPNSEQISYSAMYIEGMDLMRRKEFSEIQLETYRNRVAEKSLTEELQWLIEWLIATQFLRGGDYSCAFPHYKRAFDLSKYKIGAEIYSLVNDYAEACAKAAKPKEFKTLIRWASFNNVKVRWCSNSKMSDDAISSAYEMFKKC